MKIREVHLFNKEDHRRYFLCDMAMKALQDSKIDRETYDCYYWYLWYDQTDEKN